MGDRDISPEARELNEISRPLGYAVRVAAGLEVGNDRSPYCRFTMHRIDQQDASGPTFDNAEDVRAYLDEVASWPLWRIDLDDESIEFDPTNLTIKDRRTGETFSFKDWGFAVTGDPKGTQRAGAYEGAIHLSTRAKEAPKIGRWYKSNMS